MECKSAAGSAAEPAGRFFTQDGIDVPAVTAEQMREVDRIAVDETGPNLFQMMENAGRNLALPVMALALPKRGLLPQNTGALFLADIGIPEGVYRRLGLTHASPFARGCWVPLTYRSPCP